MQYDDNNNDFDLYSASLKIKTKLHNIKSNKHLSLQIH